VLGLVLIELEAVLEARTATAGDVDAQLEVGIAFLADQLADLRGRGRGEVQRLLELLVARGGRHGGGIRYGTGGTWPGLDEDGPGATQAAASCRSLTTSGLGSCLGGLSPWIRRPVIIAPAAICTTW